MNIFESGQLPEDANSSRHQVQGELKEPFTGRGVCFHVKILDTLSGSVHVVGSGYKLKATEKVVPGSEKKPGDVVAGPFTTRNGVFEYVHTHKPTNHQYDGYSVELRTLERVGGYDGVTIFPPGPAYGILRSLRDRLRR